MHRFLVTTALEETWSKKEPVLFLGDWCKLYSRKHVWGAMNTETVPYCWNDGKEYKIDYDYVVKLYESLLICLSQDLNKLHDVSYEVQFWRILIGPWLNVFISILFERWKMLSLAVSNYGATTTVVLDFDEERMISRDFNQFGNWHTRDDWNHFIYSSIIKATGLIDFMVVKQTEPINPLGPKVPFSCRKLAGKLGKKLFHYPALKHEAVVFSTNFSLPQLFNLHRSLGQFPGEPQFSESLRLDINWEARKNLVCSYRPQNQFETIMCNLLVKQIPVLYLEGFRRLIQQIEGSFYPQKPKYIYSSMGFWSNDVFKAWAALQSQKGSKIITGQHGGTYGIAKFHFAEEHEISISNFWVSWGWEAANNLKVMPGFCTKNLKNKSAIKYCNPTGNILLICHIGVRYSYKLFSGEISSRQSQALEQQMSFVSKLSPLSFKRLVVRLYPEDYGWEQKLRWNDQFPNLKIEDKKTNYKKSLSNCALAITASNQTTFLETLAMNIPTIIFWDPKIIEIRKEAEKEFELLESAGIFHRTPESAAKKVNELAFDVRNWWESTVVQKVRNNFMQQYVRIDKDTLKFWKCILQG